VLVVVVEQDSQQLAESLVTMLMVQMFTEHMYLLLQALLM
jgi:hypothetical protein